MVPPTAAYNDNCRFWQRKTTDRDVGRFLLGGFNPVPHGLECFPQFLNKNRKGKYVYTRGGDDKFLIDFKLFDKNGKIIPQENIQPIFDNALNKQILEDYVSDEKAKVPNDEIYDRVKDALGLSESKKATLGKRSDADSHNSLSEGLPLAGSERLCGMALTPPEDFTKKGKSTEIAKVTATKLINEGRFKRGRIRQVYWLFISRGV